MHSPASATTDSEVESGQAVATTDSEVELEPTLSDPHCFVMYLHLLFVLFTLFKFKLNFITSLILKPLLKEQGNGLINAMDLMIAYEEDWTQDIN